MDSLAISSCNINPGNGIGIKVGGSEHRRLNVYEVFVIETDDCDDDIGLLPTARVLAASDVEAALRAGRASAHLPQFFRVVVRQVA